MGQDEARGARARRIQRFVHAAKLGVEDIRKREPPAPDIHCVIDGEERGFELVEIAPQVMKYNRQRTVDTTERLQEELDERVSVEPSVGEALQHRHVVIRFAESPTRRRVNAAPEIFSRAVDLARSGEREWRPPPSDSLTGLVKRIQLVATEAARPTVFGASAVAGWNNDLLDSIGTKLGKSYESDAPIDLLAYYELPVAPTDEYMRGYLIPWIEGMWARRTNFERLWICDLATGWLYGSPHRPHGQRVCQAGDS